MDIVFFIFSIMVFLNLKSLKGRDMDRAQIQLMMTLKNYLTTTSSAQVYLKNNNNKT